MPFTATRFLTWITVFLTAIPATAGLVHQWTFDGTLEDLVGTAHGEVFNGAELTADGQLSLDAFENQYFRTAPIDDDITAKTLVAWATLNDLDEPRAGSILTIEDAEGQQDVFDGIIYAERTERQWMAGSDFFRRTPSANNGGADEESEGEIMMAIAYDLDGHIDIYRNGESYADYDTIDPPTYSGGFGDVLIGPRHEDRIAAGGPMHFIDGLISEARIYDEALTAEEVLEIFQAGPGTGNGLRAGDADMDCDFDQLDLVQVQVAAKYLTGEAATWGEGDWDGAPGGSVADRIPPSGNGQFDQLDIIAALTAGQYLQGSYCAEGGFAAIAIPEPSTFFLLAFGLSGILLGWRRKR